MKKFIAIILAIFLIIGLFTACTEADKVNANISKQAEYFGCERRVTGYNARTDNIIMYIEGFINIDNNTSSELVVTAKVGPDTYKKKLCLPQ